MTDKEKAEGWDRLHNALSIVVIMAEEHGENLNSMKLYQAVANFANMDDLKEEFEKLVFNGQQEVHND